MTAPRHWSSRRSGNGRSSAKDYVERLVAAYGTRVANVLQAATRPDDLGVRFGADLTATEVRYLMTKEWAQTADDVLWRRSKLGLRVSRQERVALDQLHEGGKRLSVPSIKFYRNASFRF